MLKFLPLAIAIIYCAHAGVSFFGSYCPVVMSWLTNAGLMWCPLLFLASYGRGFCIIHRFIIAYDTLACLIVHFGLTGGFVDLAVFASGLVIIVAAFRKLKTCK